jgi:hypothetical protein
MAIFDLQSRYRRHAGTYTVVDRRGRTVTALTPARPPAEVELGEHARKEGERLDHLAGHYLDDPTAFWRLSELADVVLPDALAETPVVKIPVR